MQVTCVFCSKNWEWNRDMDDHQRLGGRFLDTPANPWVCCDGCKYHMLQSALIMITGNVLLEIYEDGGD